MIYTFAQLFSLPLSTIFTNYVTLHMSPYPFIKTKIHIKPIQKIIFLHKKRMKEKKGSYRVSEERNALSRMEISWRIWSVSSRTATATAELQLLEGSRPHRSICLLVQRSENQTQANRTAKKLWHDRYIDGTMSDRCRLMRTRQIPKICIATDRVHKKPPKMKQFHVNYETSALFTDI